MKYILDYLSEVQFIQPVPGAEVKTIEECVNFDCPGVGRRLVINDRETDIVVWYADYDTWLEKKYEDIKQQLYNYYEQGKTFEDKVEVYPDYSEEN
jgi:hypothetical protein